MTITKDIPIEDDYEEMDKEPKTLTSNRAAMGEHVAPLSIA